MAQHQVRVLGRAGQLVNVAVQATFLIVLDLNLAFQTADLAEATNQETFDLDHKVKGHIGIVAQ